MNLKKFKGFMAAKGISQKELANLLDISVASVSLKVNNKQPFTLSQIQKICKAYSISADAYFLD